MHIFHHVVTTTDKEKRYSDSIYVGFYRELEISSKPTTRNTFTNDKIKIAVSVNVCIVFESTLWLNEFKLSQTEKVAFKDKFSAMTGPNRCAQPTNLNHDEEDVDLFTSLRYDPQLLRSKKNSALAANKTAGSSLYMLQYHRDRISAAAKHFGWEAAVSRLADLTAFESYLLQEVETFREANGRLPDQPLRVRTCKYNFTAAYRMLTSFPRFV